MRADVESSTGPLTEGEGARAADWLWANPVLRRELAQGRRPSTRLGAAVRWLGLALALLAYGAGAYWLSRGERSPWEARAFLLGLCLLYLLWLTVAAPGPAATRISGEREQRTWQALLLTALRPSQVVAAKLLASLRPSLVALGQFLPLLLMSTHAGLLPATRLAQILSVLLAAALGVVAMALWLSGRCLRTRNAVLLAYLLTGLDIWGALACSPNQLIRGENLWWYVSPAWQVAILCLAEPGRSPLARPLLPEWAWFLLGWAALSGLSLALLTRRITRSGE